MPEPIIPSDAVKAIQDSVQTHVLEMDGIAYFSRPVHLPPAEPTTQPIRIHTLTGIVDYLRANIDDLGAAIALHVVSPTEVRLIDSVQGDRHKQRNTWAIADCKPIIGSGFEFGKFMASENFVINLQSQFVQSEAIASVLKIAGNLRDSNVREFGDDGVSQQVVAKVGIAQVGNVALPNPVLLSPYRTFPEVTQPESAFVLRLKSGQKEGELPSCALFEADGGQWKLDAIKAVAEWLKSQDISVPVIA